MKLGKFLAVFAVLSGVAISSVGCVDKKKYDELNQQYTDLTLKYNTVQEQEKACRVQLAQAENEKSLLEQQVSRLQNSLDSATAEIARLKSGQTGPGPQPGDRTGETTVYRKTVGVDILFSSGKATLTDGGKKELDAIAATLKNSHAGTVIRVYGYTDGDPINKSKNLWQDNLDLSANRAMAVTRYLTGKGIEAGRIETIGMGETNPVAPNNSTANKAKNRRVEIVAVK